VAATAASRHPDSVTARRSIAPASVPLFQRVATEVRRRLDPSQDGELWLCFVDRHDAVVLCLAVAEGTHNVDELFLRHVVDVIRSIGTPQVVLAVHRADARPVRADRLLWRETCVRLADARVARVDLLVVGPAATWSPRKRGGAVA
jgi:hypothetical protein